DDLDRAIAKFAARSLAQLDAVGRAILLMALAELRYRPDVPTKVVINEAVELAKRYGAAESFRFVNAVLDKAARSEGFRGAPGSDDPPPRGRRARRSRAAALGACDRHERVRDHPPLLHSTRGRPRGRDR